MNSAANYYMISNRKYDEPTGKFLPEVSTNGTLTFFSTPASSPGTFMAMTYANWLAAVKADIQRCASVPGPAPGRAAEGLPLPPIVPLCSWVTIFEHGYGVTFEDANTVFPTYFANLAANGYGGVLIGFDWPSDDDMVNQPDAFHQAKANAVTTAEESFPTEAPPDDQPRLLQVLKDIQSAQSPALTVCLGAICHSMGNYLMFEGATAFATQSSTPLFQQIVCAAAMLDANGFNDASSPTYCADITAAAMRVTIYYSSNDDVLPTAEGPKYDGYPELGINGPTYGSTLLKGVFGVDCSAVVNAVNAKKYEPDQNHPLAHTAYFFIPQVLQDIAATLQGVVAHDLSDRTPIDGSDGAGFTMNALPD
ncbi:MAG: alpha/beta hydrolase [Minicystis sp.]